MGALDSQGFPGLCLHLGRGLCLTRLALMRSDPTRFLPPPCYPIFLFFETYFLNTCWGQGRRGNCPVRMAFVFQLRRQRTQRRAKVAIQPRKPRYIHGLSVHSPEHGSLAH